MCFDYWPEFVPSSKYRPLFHWNKIAEANMQWITQYMVSKCAITVNEWIEAIMYQFVSIWMQNREEAIHSSGLTFSPIALCQCVFSIQFGEREGFVSVFWRLQLTHIWLLDFIQSYPVIQNAIPFKEIWYTNFDSYVWLVSALREANSNSGSNTYMCSRLWILAKRCYDLLDK